MAKGSGGRIVIEIEPDLKHRLHALLALRGITLKDWFVSAATEFVGEFAADEVPGARREVAVDIDIPAEEEA
jgi:hypothetical protein